MYVSQLGWIDVGDTLSLVEARSAGGLLWSGPRSGGPLTVSSMGKLGGSRVPRVVKATFSAAAHPVGVVCAPGTGCSGARILGSEEGRASGIRHCVGRSPIKEGLTCGSTNPHFTLGLVEP